MLRLINLYHNVATYVCIPYQLCASDTVNRGWYKFYTDKGCCPPTLYATLPNSFHLLSPEPLVA